MSEKRLLARVAPLTANVILRLSRHAWRLLGLQGMQASRRKSDEKGKLERAEYYVDMRGWTLFLYEGKRTICTYITEVTTAAGGTNSITIKRLRTLRYQDEHYARW